jgi:hypothetical protein
MFNTKPRTRSSVRTILSVAGMTGAVAAVAAVPASASAAVRTGSVQDPQGDASGLSGPVLDIESASVRYDDVAGTVRVAWTYYGDVRANRQPTDGQVGGGLWMDGPTGSSTPSAVVAWSHFPDGSGGPFSITTSLSLSYTAGTLSGTGTVSADGRVVTAEFTHPQLVGRDWQRGDGSVRNGDAVPRFWFDGYSEPAQAPVGPIGPLPVPPAPSDGGAADADQSMTINGGAQFTNDPDVTLSVIAPSWASRLRVANDGGFRDAESFAVKKKIRWRLAESGPERLPKTVYLRFGNEAQNFTDDIILDQTNPTVTTATVDGPSAAATSAAVAATVAAKRPTYRVRVRAKDGNSGVARVQFARSKRHPSALAKLERINRYRGARAPKYVRVKDRAGNYSRWRSIR